MGLIEYVCYSVKADEGFIKQPDDLASFSSRLFVKCCGIVTNYRRKHEYLSQLLFPAWEQR